MFTINDIYQKFGCVAETAQLLETELGNFLIEENNLFTELIENPNPKKADEFIKCINKKTLGQNLRCATDTIPSFTEISSILYKALKSRNKLIHSFYRKHNLRLRTKCNSGRKIMDKDLDSIHVDLLQAYKLLLKLAGHNLEAENRQALPLENGTLPDHLDIS